MGGFAWSEEEDAIFMEIYNGETSIIAGAKRLPRRSIAAIRARRLVLGLPARGICHSRHRWVMQAIEESLREYGTLNVHQLVTLTGASLTRIMLLVREGHGERFHIAGWERIRPCGGPLSAIWALGKGEDATRPVPLTQSEKNRRAYIKKCQRRGAINPFLAAAGLLNMPTAQAGGRVYKQAMTITEDNEETV